MAVKDFIPLSDSKITIEKQVRRKPSIEELTTIETPGKPVPASNFEENKKRVNKKTQAKTSPKKVREPMFKPIKNTILIITEKPQAAQKIASALGNPIKRSEDGVPYYELTRGGKIITVASAVGHLFNLTYSSGQKGWPLFNLEWQPSYVKKGSEFTKKYYNVLAELAKTAETIIVATDYDIEGEVIGWNVVRFICRKTTAKRMKFSTLTAPELEQAYESVHSELNWGNAYAGETRHYLDWMYGINLSRALMSAIKTTGSFRLLSIGRVQGPALKIIVDREREIDAFKPEPYWQVFAKAKDIEFKHPQDIFDQSLLEQFKDIKEAKATTKTTEVSTPPPVPFDLTTLQREAYRFFKMSPSDTLATAQKLYIDGMISYPRTSSQKIPDAIQPKKILKSLSKNFAFVKEATREKPMEGKKSDPAHPSIYPTGEFTKLAGKEEKLYNLIVQRFVAAFCPDAIIARKQIELLPIKKPELNFTANAATILKKGWMAVYPSETEESELPDISGIVKIDEIKIVEKETLPPSRFTPASLITILEKKNLGTKSTRSNIVDTLFERGYLDGKSIKATPLGMRLIESLEQHSPIIIDENLTRQLEEEMEKIQESDKDLLDQERRVLEKAKEIISKIAEEFKAKEKEIGAALLKGLEVLRQEQNEANTLMPCQTCKKGNLRIMFSKKSRRAFVACSAYPACTQTYSLPPNSLIKKAENDKRCEADNFPKLLAIRKAKRPWEFCFNPDCPIEKQKREEWQAKLSKRAADKSSTETTEET